MKYHEISVTHHSHPFTTFIDTNLGPSNLITPWITISVSLLNHSGWEQTLPFEPRGSNELVPLLKETCKVHQVQPSTLVPREFIGKAAMQNISLFEASTCRQARQWLHHYIEKFVAQRSQRIRKESQSLEDMLQE